MKMNEDLVEVLNALYRVEQENLLQSDFDAWCSPDQVAAALPEENARRGDVAWVRAQLQTLWLARKVMQLPEGEPQPVELRDVMLLDLDRHGNEDGRLRLEENDVRGADSSPFAQAAIFPADARGVPLPCCRTRAPAFAKLSALPMAPSTGVLRYERRPQERPKGDSSSPRSRRWCADIVSRTRCG